LAKKDYDKTLTRLIGILTKLGNGERCSTQELADEYNVGIRTIQKDVKEKLMYFDIIRDSQGKLMLSEGTNIGKTTLKNDELILVSLALAQFKDVSNFDKLADTVLKKLLYPRNFNPYFVKNDDLEDIEIDSYLIKEIKSAIQFQNHLVIKGIRGDIEVEPYKIAAYEGIWYLVAKDEVDQRTKTFMLNRIKEVEIKPNKHKVSQQQVQVMLEKTHSAWFQEGNCFFVKIKVDKNIAIYFKRKDFLQSQKIEDELEDGSLIVSFEVSHDEDIDNIIKSWLPDIEVLEPKRYRTKILKELKLYIDKLEKTN
jgi:predicted DNA-binding transcriptional regulator YafY